jgi:hypothetical protein
MKTLRQIHRILQCARSAIQEVQSKVLSLMPGGRAAAKTRAAGLVLLNIFSRAGGANLVPGIRKVLIDGTWDNANYWTRFAIVRRALSLDSIVEVGLLGQYSRKKSRSAFTAFGISEFVDLQTVSQFGRYVAQAQALLRTVKSADELISIYLPYDFPPEIFYDGVLKRQRSSTVDIADPMLPNYLAETIAALHAGEDIVARGGFDLVILSHVIDYVYGAIAWAAIRHSIPVLALYGDFGHTKFFHLKKSRDLFMYPERPTNDELSSLSLENLLSLKQLGAQQLGARLGGKTADVGAIYAYRRRQGPISRNEMASQFGWDVSRPTIGIYNSNWFDFPHSSGLHSFRDFLDWIKATIDIAKVRTEINWLFKSHPCDDWYDKINGQRLEDLVAEINLPHIRLADKTWSGLDLIRSLDGIVTCHGTIGLEATSQSVPVLVPYAGWYGHAGFVTSAKSRDDYLSKLQSAWWLESNTDANREQAELFAGWAFCVPDWYEDCFFHDDSQQDIVYSDLKKFLLSNLTMLEREADEVADWFIDGHPYYHIFSMKRASGFRLGNCET